MRSSLLPFALAAVVFACAADQTIAERPVPSPELNLHDVMARVRTNWRAEENGWTAALDNYAVVAAADGYELFASREQNPWRLGRTSISRGGQQLGVAGAVTAIGTEATRAVSVGVEETFRLSPEHAEQSWSFASKPEGSGELTVRMDVTGLELVASTSTGLHFADPANGVGFRYGHATWIDARGQRTSVEARLIDGAIELNVPEAVIDESSFPAVLDPVVSAENGVDVPAYAAADRTQSDPVAAFDGTNYLVVWDDSRGWPSHGFNIYGARLTPAGAVLDVSGIAIATTPEQETSPAVAFAGSNYLVVWESATLGLIQGVRVSTAGQVIDQTAITINQRTNYVDVPAIASDGSNFLVVWTGVPGSQNMDVMGRLISTSGAPAGAEFVIGQATLNQKAPDVAAGTSGYFVAWEDSRAGSTVTDIYGARVSSAGVVQDTAGIAISTATGNQTNPEVASNGTDFLVAWDDLRSTTTLDVYAARVNGGVVQETNGLAVSSGTGTQRFASAIWDGTNYQLVYEDSRSGSTGVYGMRVSPAGALVDGTTGVAIATGSKTAPAIARGSTASLVVFEASSDVYAIGFNGGAVAGTSFRVSNGADSQYEPAVAFDGTNYLLAWASISDIYAVQVSPSGAPLQQAAVAVHVGSGVQDQPAVACSSTNCLIVYGNGSIVSAKRVSKSNGAVLDTTPLVLPNPNGSEYAPKVVFNGTDYVVAFTNQYTLSSTTTWDIFGARVTTAGVVRDTTALQFAGAGANQHEAALASNGTNTLIVYDQTGGPNISHVWARTLTDSGGTPTLSTPVQLSGTVSTNLYVSAASDGTNYLVTWEGTPSGAYQVYATRVTSAVSVLDSPALTFGTSTNDVAAAWTGQRYLLVWREYIAPYNDDVDAVEIPSTGAASSVFDISSTESDELTPAVAGSGGKALVAYSRMVYEAPYGAHRIEARIVSPTGTPTAYPQTKSTQEDTAASVTLTGVDPEGAQLTFTVTRQPTNGTLTGTAPNVTYTPAANFNGQDSFAFTVSDGALSSPEAVVQLTVTAVNDAPVATAQTVAATEDTAKTLTLGGTDVDGDTLSFTVLTQPASGTLSGTAPNLTFTPPTNFNGSTSFTFRASDGALSSTATVTINVAAVNDAPTAANANATTPEDTPVQITLSGADIDSSGLSYVIGANPTNGTVTGSGANVVYTPSPNFYGTDTFRFRTSDGQLTSSLATITVTVSAVNDAPTAEAFTFTTGLNTPYTLTLRGSDVENDALTFTASTPQHGTISGAGAERVYTPDIGFEGQDSFTYTASDGQNTSAAATVLIDVVAGNRAPVVEQLLVSTPQGTPVQIELKATDADKDALTFAVTAQPTFGSVTGAGPIVTYTPKPGFSGIDSFRVTATDGKVTSAPVDISIRVEEGAQSQGCGCNGASGAPVVLALIAAARMLLRRRSARA